MEADSCCTIQGLGIALVAAKVAEVPVTIIDSNPASIQKSLDFMS
jgi:3-hydroxybutyryl-CoA dehydrogenase